MNLDQLKTTLQYIDIELRATNKHVLWIAFSVGVLIGLSFS